MSLFSFFPGHRGDGCVGPVDREGPTEVGQDGGAALGGGEGVPVKLGKLRCSCLTNVKKTQQNGIYKELLVGNVFFLVQRIDRKIRPNNCIPKSWVVKRSSQKSSHPWKS